MWRRELTKCLRGQPAPAGGPGCRKTQQLPDNPSFALIFAPPSFGEEAEKTVSIVGKTADGRWAGLKTTVVETEGGRGDDKTDKGARGSSRCSAT
jgi:hypothetical protein